MRCTLQVLAVMVAVAVLTVWAAQGANPGWTKTQVQMKTIDEVTGIEKIEWQKQFVPGLDFLGGGLFAAGALAVASRFIRKPTNQ